MVPIPIRDENPTHKAPVVTLTLILVNSLIWVYQYFFYGLDASILDFGAIPAWVLHGIREGQLDLPTRQGVTRVLLHQEVPHPLTVLTSMFLHGGWLHVIGNMWFLWIFGDNVEDSMGRLRFVVFYLLCGILAAGAQILTTPSSKIPMVGASGAIAGVLGAYLVLHPHAKIRSLWVLFIFITTVDLPAWLLLVLWLVSQFFVHPNAGVAWMAHVGGFVAGFLLVPLFRQKWQNRPPRAKVGQRPKITYRMWN